MYMRCIGFYYFSPQIQSTNPAPLSIQGPRVHWYRPVSLEQLLLLRDRFPLQENGNKTHNRIVAGNTDIQHCKSIVISNCIVVHH